jgi:starch-binding outer membrane protein, SusD/RagB family
MRQMTTASMLLVAALALSTGCDLLDTDQPNIVEPEDVESEAGALTRRVGAISDFSFAQDGDGTLFEDGHILLSGLMSDEFMLSTTPPTEQEVDQRRVFENNGTVYDMFHNLHRARAAAEAAAVALRELRAEPDADNFIGEMLSLAGFTYLYFGESFCSGVPFSHLEGDQLVFGEPQTTDETLLTAIARFDAALAEPGVLLELDPESGLEPEITYLAAVGKGRALLDRGREFAAEAAAAVADVPTEFQYVTEHAESPLRLQNAIYSYGIGFLWSVSDLEGGVGLPFRTAEDPRVPFFDEESAGLDNTTPQFTLLKYPDASASVIVADGIEARLIEAEALLQSSDLGGMTAILNVLRATQGLDPLDPPGTEDEAVDQLFSERAFWMFATGHRLGDMRRLIRQYGRTADEVFPSGVYLKGGSYGDDVNIPMPQEERNNPNFTGCIDRNA